MLRRSGIYALKALLELALDPPRWQSVSALAEAQDLPGPMLEQLMLKLRRAALVEARRGRQGGYRLRRPPAEVPLAAILAAVEAPAGSLFALGGAEQDPRPSDRVTRVLNRRLLQALERELDQLTLEDLLFDLRSARAAFSESGGLLLG
ncbi:MULTISPECIES: Rrf2 family transcriptional regulator [unclassified Cyanobium]|jgi:Rrf2 family protein|uniref:RrF2 family transcriptional regulator n=1 Tax=unclassified Cyanobium TaxID=2627006 RepID=UPI0020CCD0C5|nr:MULTISPECIES: Rrf2 family transcriptional regulator [unclassified Cyanobium]MCP9798216.1 Rrf2 family transcriptional regulator [Cyanobium sp. Lug-B]MCP9932805.1 Rrf2 family transcriptional regulator [Cyanobium sp. Candia 9D4]